MAGPGGGRACCKISTVCLFDYISKMTTPQLYRLLCDKNTTQYQNEDLSWQKTEAGILILRGRELRAMETKSVLTHLGVLIARAITFGAITFGSITFGSITFGVIVFSYGSAAQAVVTYNFSGDCTVDCSGTDPQGRVELVLTDAYVPGTALSTDVFVSFNYDVDPGDSTKLDLPVIVSATTGLQATSLSGSLPDGSGAVDFRFEALEVVDSTTVPDSTATLIFTSDQLGEWLIDLIIIVGETAPEEEEPEPEPEPEEEPEPEDEPEPEPEDEQQDDAGISGVWSLAAGPAANVPEPAGLALFGLGVLGLAMARRRLTRPHA